MATEDRFIPVSRRLSKSFGPCGAMLVQQVSYWCSMMLHKKEGHWWVYKTYEEWAEELGAFSPSTIKRAAAALRKAGILVTRDDLNYHRYDKTLWYRVDFEALKNHLESAQTLVSKWHSPSGQIDPMEKVNLTPPIPEMTNKDDLHKNAMNADEILAAKKQEKAAVGKTPMSPPKKVTASSLAMLWKKRLSLEGGFVKNLTQQEVGQLGHVLKGLGDKAYPTLDWCLQNWSAFVVGVKYATGYSAVPEKPQIGFFVKHYGVAVQLIAEKSTAKVAQSIPSAVPINHPPPITAQKKYVEDDFEPVDPDQLQADLAMFEAMSKKP